MRFTPYIKAMQPRDCPAELLKAVKDRLEHTMKKKRVWTAPPAILGFPEYDSWTSDAFQDLTFHCFIYAITERLHHLQNAIKAGSDNIDGLVNNNIENFLLDLQKKHDPIGYFLARNARLAIEELLNTEAIKAAYLAKKNTVNNNTLLIFAPFQIKQASSEEQLEAHIKTIVNWQDDLPILRKQEINPDTQTRMVEIILRLGQAVYCFRFRSFMQVFKVGAWQLGKPEMISLSQSSDDDDGEQSNTLDTLLPPVLDIAIDWSAFESFAQYIYAKSKTDNEKQVWATIIEHFAEYQEMPTTRFIASQTNIPKSTVVDVMKKIRSYSEAYLSDKN